MRTSALSVASFRITFNINIRKRKQSKAIRRCDECDERDELETLWGPPGHTDTHLPHLLVQLALLQGLLLGPLAVLLLHLVVLLPVEHHLLGEAPGARQRLLAVLLRLDGRPPHLPHALVSQLPNGGEGG